MAAVELIQQIWSILSFWNLLLLLVTLLYFYWWRRPNARYPLGPRGFPLLGVLPFLGKYPGETFKKWSLEKYGPVMSVRLGREDAVVLNTFEAVNQAFVKQGSAFSDRPYMAIFCSLIGKSGVSFLNYNDDFKIQKHFGLRFLRDKGLARKKMEDLINKEGDAFVKFIKQHGTRPLNLKEYLYWVTSNVVSKFTLGKRHDYDEPAFREVLEAISMLFTDPETSGRMNVINQYAFLAKVPWFKQAMDKYESRMQTIIDYCNKNIKDHKEKFDPENVDDFIDSFLYEAKFGKEHTRSSFTDKQLIGFCRDLFVAGSETSSTTLTWFFVFYLNFPEYRKIIDSEINETFGEGENPSMSKKDKLPITCAFLQEVTRCRTLAPFGILHATGETCELMGYIIPKGTTVIPNLQGVHMDPNTWPNPEEFNPHRHIDEDGKFVPSSKVIPFSIGARFCLGESLARAEVFLIFVKVIQHFHLRPAEGLPPFDNPHMTIVLSPQECVVCAELKHH